MKQIKPAIKSRTGSISIGIFLICFLISYSGKQANAQIDLQCDGRDRHSIYLIDYLNFYRIDSVDVNPTNPLLLTSIPYGTNGGGISINKNLDSIAGPETMYFIATNSPYYFWNNTGWTNTGNICVGGGTLNIGGTSNYIFNFADNERDMHRYDGTGNCTLLLSNIVSNGGVIHDVATDNAGNFYLFFTNDQKIIAYNPSGIPIDSFTTSGFPMGPNCGFTILGDRIYAVTCNGINELYEGIKSGTNFNFTSIKIISPGSGYFIDIASCPEAALPLVVFKNPESPRLEIYPNPAQDYAIIHLENTTLIEISDCMGILKQTISTNALNEYYLDLSKWAKGVYFINASSKNNTTTRKTFVVQ